MTNLSGRRLGQYELIEEIGHGGMAVVYRATQTSIGREVAVKILPSHFLQDRTFLERFSREVKIITRLQHPRILPVFDFGQEDGIPYVVMAYIAGGTLADLIEHRGPMSLKETAAIISQVAEALDYAHDSGIIHRDFKPSNVLLDARGNTYLADFGIAKAAEATVQLTGSGMVGTPFYMAPEVAQPGGVTHLVDVYALGVTMFLMLTGRVPYEADTPMGALMAHAVAPIPNLKRFRSDLPDSAQGLINRALAKDAIDRFQSAGELAKALQEVAAAPAVAPPAAAPVFSQERTMIETPAEVAAYAQQQTPPPIPLTPTPAPVAIPAPSWAADQSSGFGTGAFEQPKRSKSGLLIAGGALGLVAMCLIAILGVGAVIIGRGSSGASIASLFGPTATSTSTPTPTANAAATQTAVAKQAQEQATHQAATERAANKTATAEARASATAAAISGTATAEASLLNEVSQWPVVESDHFGTNQNGWGTGALNLTEAKGDQSVSAGVYEWDFQSTPGVFLKNAPIYLNTHLYDRFAISVTATRTGGDSQSGFGIVFGAKDDDNFYAFIINDGFDSGWVGQLVGNVWKTTYPWEGSDIGVLKQQANDLLMVVDGTQITLYVNGHQVGELKASIVAGYTGLAVNIQKGDSIIVKFDDFVVRAP
jgi:serine/threonine protein kinase